MPLQAFQQLPAGLEMRPQIQIAVLIFLGTFVLEDAAAVTAGLLIAAGSLGWLYGFVACFLGIWIGDIGLYGFARIVGRNFFERTPLRRFSDRAKQSERWFDEHGSAILISSRLVPGARLPTYLAAGFLCLPFRRFLGVTGLAVSIWTAAVLGVSQILGAKLLLWASAVDKKGLVLAAGVVLIFALLRLVRRIFVPRTVDQFAVKVARCRSWEFWPAWLFYLPVGIYYLYLALKFRSLGIPTAANPGIFSGGIIGESKLEMLSELAAGSPDFTADAELVVGVTAEERLATVAEICARRNISLPFILKPDVGQRGAGIKLIRTLEQAAEYFRHTNAAIILQRYAPGPFEVGIFYYRFPGESRGSIFSITEKIFPEIKGDGQSSIAQLICKDSRCRIIAQKYLRRFESRQHEVLAAGEALKLVEAGNHAQGCIFRDGMRLCTPALAERIDAISQKVNGFFIGRYDIRFAEENELRAGKSFKIVELNGAAAEASNIYDARNSLFKAYQILFKQWDLVFAIGAANRKRGCHPMKLRLIWKKWRDYLKIAATYPAAD